MAVTDVDWADKVWNPTAGCDWTSEGCDNCYAMAFARRLKAMGVAKYQNDGDPRTSGPGFLATEHETALDAPLHVKKACRWFVNSMGELFHKRISTGYIAKVFAIMAATPHHTYQLLTKQPARMRSLLNSPEFWALVWKELQELPVSEDVKRQTLGVESPLANLWLGVSVENQYWAKIRIPLLLDTPAAVRWLSCEPLLGPLDLSEWLAAGRPPISWVVVGGESRVAKARPMRLEWVRELLRQTRAAGVAFFFKQLGTELASEYGIKGKGNKPEQWPVPMPREFPAAA